MIIALNQILLLTNLQTSIQIAMHATVYICMQWRVPGQKKTWREIVENDCQARKLNWIVKDGGCR